MLRILFTMCVDIPCNLAVAYRYEPILHNTIIYVHFLSLPVFTLVTCTEWNQPGWCHVIYPQYLWDRLVDRESMYWAPWPTLLLCSQACSSTSGLQCCEAHFVTQRSMEIHEVIDLYGRWLGCTINGWTDCKRTKQNLDFSSFLRLAGLLKPRSEDLI